MLQGYIFWRWGVGEAKGQRFILTNSKDAATYSEMSLCISFVWNFADADSLRQLEKGISPT